MSPCLETHENREYASEIKFLIEPEVADQIRNWARLNLAADPHAAGPRGDEYRITSIYFDTADFDVFHRKGSFGRSKYRIRRYGEANFAFLERKLRTRRFLTKRRSIVRLDELERLGRGAREPGRRTSQPPGQGWAGHWFYRRLNFRELAPVCQISYERTARVAMTANGPVRLTLDHELRAMPTDSIRFQEGQGMWVLPAHVVLEMKFLVALPSAFKYLVEEFALEARPFSKYRLAAQSLGLVKPADAQQEIRTPHSDTTLCLTF